MARITAKTARGAATELHREIVKICRQFGMKSDCYPVLVSPEAERALSIPRFPHWTVSWEHGPYDWAMAASHGESIWEEELFGTRGRNPATFEGLEQNENWGFELYSSWEVQFYSNREDGR